MSSDNASDEGAFVVLDFHGDGLDPAPLISMIPLEPVRPRKRGDPLGSPMNGKTPTAKTGYCGFSTDRKVRSTDPNAHVEFLLDLIHNRLAALREVMNRQSLDWRAVLFEGGAPGQGFSDLDDGLLHRAAEMGLPLIRKVQEKMTVVSDVSQSR